jgi:hypothetical protein
MTSPLTSLGSEVRFFLGAAASFRSIRLAALALGFTTLAACGGSSTQEPKKDDDTSGGSSAGATGGSGGSGAAPTTGGSGATTAGGSGGSGGSAPGGSGPGGPGATQPTVPSCENAPSATAPAAAWTDIGGGISCGSVNLMAAQPCSNMVVAAMSETGLAATTDGGATWTALGTSGDVISNGPTRVIFDPATPTTFWESGIYGWQDPWTQGVFKTTDNGVSFKGYLNLSITQSHQDSVSIDFIDPARMVQMSGGHEQKGVLFISSDGGENFAEVGGAFPADVQSFCTNTYALDSGNLLAGCASSWSGSAGAILRTTDLGASFTKVSDEGVNGYALWASDGTLYWPAESGGMMKSTDVGVTWTKLAGGSPASQFVSAQSPFELPDGRIVGTDGTNITVSADQGATWTPIGEPTGGGHFTYSAQTKTFFKWGDGGCQTSGWDYETN